MSESGASKMKHKLCSDEITKSCTAPLSEGSSSVLGCSEVVRPTKIARTSKTVPSSPIWQMSPSHEVNCEWAPPCGYGVNMGGAASPGRSLSHLVSLKLKREREVLIDEWISELKRRQQSSVTQSQTSSSVRFGRPLVEEA